MVAQSFCVSLCDQTIVCVGFQRYRMECSRIRLRSVEMKLTLLLFIYFSQTQLAEHKKEEGNTFYKQQKYKEALECYTQAISMSV